MGKKRTYRSAQQWQSLVQKHEDSGLSAPAFCQTQGVGYQSFMKWQKRLNSAKTPAEQRPENSFIELTSPAGIRDTGAESLPDTPSPVSIELCLGDGVELRITRRF